MIKIIKVSIYCILFFGLFSCEPDSENIPDISNVPPVKVEIERMEDLFRLKDKFQIAEYLDKHPVLTQQFFKIEQYPSDSVLINMIYKFSTDPHTDTLVNDVERIFPNADQLKKELEAAFAFLKYYYPDFEAPKIYTSISGFGSFGFGSDLYYSEKLIVIGMDWYAGKSSTYRPQEIPNYMLRRYEPEYIVPNIVTYMSAKYNTYDFKDRSLLADMLYYGKAYHFTKKMLPYTPDSLIIGYTTEELELSEQFVEIIWGSFIQENLFYITSESQKSLYIGERPNVIEIADKCPGRIGRWLGWKIVNEHAKRNKESSLSDLMKMKNAQKLFQESRFKPQVN